MILGGCSVSPCMGGTGTGIEGVMSNCGARFKLFIKADMDLAAVLLITAGSEGLSGTGSRQKLKSLSL